MNLRPIRLFLREFLNLVSLLLTLGAAFALAIGDYLTASAIFVSVVLSGVLGFVMEYRADRALLALRSLHTPTATVRRAGLLEEVPVGALTTADVVILATGRRVPADARITQSQVLAIDESMLTGESMPLEKDPGDMVYAGTMVAGGAGEAAVVATGAETALGDIERSVASVEREATPLEIRLAQLGRWLIAAFFIVCALVVVLGLIRGMEAEAVIKTGIALAVGAIPEGLPAVAAITLAVGTRRLARRGAIVRRLDSIETLGAVTTIATDKTGTLTEGLMRVTTIAVPGSGRIAVSGSGYDPEGAFTINGTTLVAGQHPQLRRILFAATLASDAVLEQDEREGWHVHGDFTDAALVVVGAVGEIDRSAFEPLWPRKELVPFTRERRYAEVTLAGEGGDLVLLKGALEAVAPRCSMILLPGGEAPLDDTWRRTIEEENRCLAGAGLRVVALADRQPGTSDRCFLGLVGIEDSLRPESPHAAAEALAAGIRVRLVTGDQPATAIAIASRLGLGAEAWDASVQWDARSAAASPANVIARMTPRQKLEMVQALAAAGEVVAVTGDGVNDAPALRAAHVGVAMGRRGTDAAREAADIVLTDDNFSTITAAIAEGRRIFRSLRLALQYLLTASWGTIAALSAMMVFGEDVPLTALQILWLNLVVHIFPALALATAPSSEDEMRRPPRRREEALLSRPIVFAIATRALFVAAAAVVARTVGDATGSLEHAQSLAYMALALTMLIGAFLPGPAHPEMPRFLASRELLAALVASLLLLTAGVYGPLAGALGTEPATGAEWGLVAVIATVAVGASQLAELLVSRRFPARRAG